MAEQHIVAAMNLIADIVADKVIQKLKEYSTSQKRNTQQTQQVVPQVNAQATQTTPIPIQTQTQTQTQTTYKKKFHRKENDSEDPNESLKKKITEMLNSLGDRKAECINYLKQKDALYNKNSTKKQILRTYAIVKEFLNQNSSGIASDEGQSYEMSNPF